MRITMFFILFSLFSSLLQCTPNQIARAHASAAAIKERMPALLASIKKRTEGQEFKNKQQQAVIRAVAMQREGMSKQVDAASRRNLLPARLSRAINNMIAPGHGQLAGGGLVGESKDYTYFIHPDGSKSRIDQLAFLGITMQDGMNIQGDSEESTISAHFSAVAYDLFNKLTTDSLTYTTEKQKAPLPLTAAARDQLITARTPFSVFENGAQLNHSHTAFLNQQYATLGNPTHLFAAGAHIPAEMFNDDTKLYHLLNTEQTSARLTAGTQLMAFPLSLFSSNAHYPITIDGTTIVAPNAHSITLPWSLNIRHLALTIVKIAGVSKLHRTFTKARKEFVADQLLNNAQLLYGSMRYKDEKSNQPALKKFFNTTFTFVPLNLFKQPEVIRLIVLYTFFYELLNLVESFTKLPEKIKPLAQMLTTEISYFFARMKAQMPLVTALEDARNVTRIPAKVAETKQEFCNQVNGTTMAAMFTAQLPAGLHEHNLAYLFSTVLPAMSDDDRQELQATINEHLAQHSLTQDDLLAEGNTQARATFLSTFGPATATHEAITQNFPAGITPANTPKLFTIIKSNPLLQSMAQPLLTNTPEQMLNMLKKDVLYYTDAEKQMVAIMLMSEGGEAEMLHDNLEAEQSFSSHYHVPHPSLFSSFFNALAPTLAAGSLPLVSVSLNGVTDFLLKGFAGAEGGLTSLLVSKFIDDPVADVPYLSAFFPNSPADTSLPKLALSEINSSSLHLNRKLRPAVYDKRIFKILRMLVVAFMTVRKLDQQHNNHWRTFFMKNQGIIKGILAQYLNPQSTEEVRTQARNKLIHLVDVGNTLPPMRSPLGALAHHLKLPKVASFFNDAQPLLRARSRALMVTNLIMFVPILGRLFGVDLFVKRFFSTIKSQIFGGS